MKCRHHNEAEAVAVCVHCGFGLCASCIDITPSGRSVCSEGCKQAALKAESALDRIHTLTLKGYRLLATVLTCLGVLGLAASLVPGLVDGFWEITAVGAVFGIAALVGGFRVRRMGHESA